MSALTSDLGRFVAAIQYDQLPHAALSLVRNAFTDTVGVIMVGLDEPVVQIVRRTCLGADATREARVCLSDTYASAPDAALIGGTAVHALDYDDQSLSGHPSAVLVPAILAEGEALGSIGRDLVTAYVAGYEVWAELLRRDAHYHRKGWHPTAVYGVIAAAAAAAPVRGRCLPLFLDAAPLISGSTVVARFTMGSVRITPCFGLILPRTPRVSSMRLWKDKFRSRSST